MNAFSRLAFLLPALTGVSLFCETVVLTAKPGNLQFFARDTHDSAAVAVAGTVSPSGPDSISVTVYKNGSLFRRTAQLPVSGLFSVSTNIHAELASYKFEIRLRDSLLVTADSVVCGDAFMVDGQSNAEVAELAYSTPWLRTFLLDSTWRNPRTSAWGIGRHLIEEEGIPIYLVNGAVGGSAIEDHRPDTLTVNTIYGRIFWRITRSGLRNRIRGVFWHQGEANGGDSVNASVEYTSLFRNMYNAWKRDFPGIEHVYLFQVHPGYCGGSYSDVQRETARRLPSLFSDVSIMSTAGIIQHDGCHYGPGGYQQMGDWMVRLVKRDLYASNDTFNITPPNILNARFLDGNRTRLLLRFDQAVVPPSDSLRDYFYLDGKGSRVDSILTDTANHTLLLVLKEPSRAVSLSYTPSASYGPNYYDGTQWHMFPFEGPWLFNARGVGALTFWGIPVPADSFLSLDTMLLDFYADNGVYEPADPVIRLANQGATVPAVTAAADSSWLHVTVSGTGNAQVFHHTADLTGLDLGKPHTAHVRLSAAGFRDLVYTVVVRPGSPRPAVLKLDPPSLFVFPGQNGSLRIKTFDANGKPFVSPVAADWTVTGGGTIDSTGIFASNGTSGVYTVNVALTADAAVHAQCTVTVDTAPLLPFIRRINFQTSATPWKAGWLANNGTPYSTVTGMGWLTSVGSSYYPLFGSRDDRQGTNFLLKSFVWADANSPFHIDAPDGDYIIRVGLGDNTSADAITAQVGADVVCRKEAATPNAVNMDTITVSGNQGINLYVKGPKWGGAVNYLVVIAKNGVDMDLVADDGMIPMGMEPGTAGLQSQDMAVAPNPFNPITTIRVRNLKSGARVQAAAFDMQGRLVWKKEAQAKNASLQLTWNAAAVSSGVYLLKIRAEGKSRVVRMVLLK